MNDPQNSSSPGTEFETFIRFFLIAHEEGRADFELHAVPADGSRRRFWRVFPRSADHTFIAVLSEPVDAPAARENIAYLMIGRHLHKKGLPLPQIHASDINKGWFIIEDFGSVNLQDAAASAPDRVSLYERVVEVLLGLQIEGAKGFISSWTCQTEKYDMTVMRRYEAEYFTEAFVCAYMGMKKEWPELEAAFTYLAGMASLAAPRFFLHRDFQSRNIMVQGRKIGIVDWQGGRLGPPGYDLASLLIDPYAGLSREEQTAIHEKYLELLSERVPEEADSFCRSYPYLALQRNLQILGAFSYLSLVQRKKHFEKYISPALTSLEALLLDLEDRKLSALTELVKALKGSMPKVQGL